MNVKMERNGYEVAYDVLATRLPNSLKYLLEGGCGYMLMLMSSFQLGIINVLTAIIAVLVCFVSSIIVHTTAEILAPIALKALDGAGKRTKSPLPRARWVR